MNFKNWLISEEIYAQNKTATVFHRTCVDCDEEQSVKAVSSILTSDFRSGAGAGCLYGCGFYTTFAIESQFTNPMQTYGKAVIKFKATDLDKYLIFQLDQAKAIHRNDYKISDQLKKLGLLDKVDKNLEKKPKGYIGKVWNWITAKDNKEDIKNKLKYYDEQQEKSEFSGPLAQEFYNQNKWIETSIKGIIYRGRRDGYCLLKYPTVQDGTIIMLGYAVAEHDDMKKMKELKENQGWITSGDKASIKSIYKLPVAGREKFSVGDNNDIVNQLLKSKNVEYTAKKLGSNLNKLYMSDISNLLQNSIDKEKMASILKDNIKKLSPTQIDDLIFHATDKNKMIELLGPESIKKLPPDNVYLLIKNTNENEREKLLEDHLEKLIIKNPQLDISIVRWMLFLTNNYKSLVSKIIQITIKNTDINAKDDSIYALDANIESLLKFAKDKDEMANIIIDNIIENEQWKEAGAFVLINYAKDKEKIISRLGSKIISGLTAEEIGSFSHSRKLNNKEQTAQIAQGIDKYHTKKTPEIQKLIDSMKLIAAK